MIFKTMYRISENTFTTSELLLDLQIEFTRLDYIELIREFKISLDDPCNDASDN